MRRPLRSGRLLLVGEPFWNEPPPAEAFAPLEWWTIDHWVSAHPDDQRAAEMHDLLGAWRRAYLEYGRRYRGWGVFVLR